MSEPTGSEARDAARVREILTRGELTARGRVTRASNAVLLCDAVLDGDSLACVHKPVAGERPLWDFPDGNLARREVAAFAVCEAMGWDFVPPTVLREGPWGEAMTQLWIETAEDGGGLLALQDGEEPEEGWKAIGLAEVEEGRTALLVHRDDPRLRLLSVLDAVINNADRKGGHLLPTPQGGLHAIDHGVSFHTDDKLRTLLWGWAGDPLPEEAVEALARVAHALDGPLAATLAPLLTEAEITALRARVTALRESGVHPEPGEEWPAIPWPPV
ncbi:SCO1664 family protein [Streptomyces sp. SPB074]|uniref:SCO1664 family protein n=1 Tax=Streptomyces sp. (strain SPB074) TaxID=465543 RepID=UPI00017F0E98|nr:SCO1664 family protein [Streptomyces sp. SPB074]EDY44650.1 phosphatidylinositol 3- and 4-kinase [Streptomyces sp. SPB074]